MDIEQYLYEALNKGLEGFRVIDITVKNGVVRGKFCKLDDDAPTHYFQFRVEEKDLTNPLLWTIAANRIINRFKEVSNKGD